LPSMIIDPGVIISELSFMVRMHTLRISNFICPRKLFFAEILFTTLEQTGCTVSTEAVMIRTSANADAGSLRARVTGS
jgi:hypothetical protein